MLYYQRLILSFIERSAVTCSFGTKSSRSKSSTETTSKLAFHLKWYANWRIRVNETKSKHITFTLERQTSPPPILDNNPGPQSSKKLKAFSFLYLDHKVLLYNKYLAHYNWDSVVPPTRKYTQTCKTSLSKTKYLLEKLITFTSSLRIQIPLLTVTVSLQRKDTINNK